MGGMNYGAADRLAKSSIRNSLLVFGRENINYLRIYFSYDP